VDEGFYLFFESLLPALIINEFSTPEVLSRLTVFEAVAIYAAVT